MEEHFFCSVAHLKAHRQALFSSLPYGKWETKVQKATLYTVPQHLPPTIDSLREFRGIHFFPISAIPGRSACHCRKTECEAPNELENLSAQVGWV